METYKGIKKAVSEAKQCNCYAIVYNPSTNEVMTIELVSMSDTPGCVAWGNTDWRLLCKGRRGDSLTMASIKTAIAEDEHLRETM